MCVNICLLNIYVKLKNMMFDCTANWVGDITQVEQGALRESYQFQDLRGRINEQALVTSLHLRLRRYVW